MNKYLKTAAYWLGFIWLSPVTLVALLLNFIGGCRFEGVSKSGGVFYFYSRNLFRVFMSKYRIEAITIGACITMAEPEDFSNPWLINHEWTHVYQELVLGVLFFPLYFASSGLAYMRKADTHKGNWFEKQAYRAEKAGRPLKLWE